MNKFNQLCVLSGTLMPDGGSKEFEEYFKNQMGVDVKFEREVKTLPDVDDNGRGVAGTGGRNDIFFYISNSHMSKFAIARLSMGIRWWEDVLENGSEKIYPEEIVAQYKNTWK